MEMLRFSLTWVTPGWVLVVWIYGSERWQSEMKETCSFGSQLKMVVLLEYNSNRWITAQCQ